MAAYNNLIFKPIYGGLIVAAIWGLNVVFMKIAMNDLPPLLFNSLRFATIAALLLPFVKISWQQLRQFLPMALIMGMGHFYLLALGLTYVPSFIASFCLLLGGPFSALLAYFLLSERLTLWQIVAIIFAAMGATVPSILSGNVTLKTGMIFIIISTFFWAFGNIQVRKFSSISTMAIQFWIAIISAPISFAFYGFSSDNFAVMEHLTPKALACLTYVVVASSIVGYALWYRLIHTHGVKQISPFALVQPVFTLLFGYILLGELLNIWQWLGSAVTLTAIYCYYYFQRNPSPNQIGT